MPVIPKALQVESDNSLSFGNYISVEKIKINKFKNGVDLYDLRTHNEITRLQKNGSLLVETVPGATIHHFFISKKRVGFDIEGFEDTQVTLELEPNKEYKIIIDDVNVGSTVANISGKVNFSTPLTSTLKTVKVELL